MNSSPWALLRRLDLKTRKLVEEIGFGEYKSAFHGRGLEFKEVRPYQWGDDVRLMDWNLTARMGSPYVKIFLEERKSNFVVLLDKSLSMEFGTRQKLKSQLALEIVSLLAFLAAVRQNRFGAIAYGEGKPLFVPAGQGWNHALSVLDRLERSSPGSGSLEEALHLVERLFKKRSFVFVISDFLGGVSNVLLPEKRLKIASKRHEVSTFVVSDPIEQTLPNVGRILLRDNETATPFYLDSTHAGIRENYRQQRATFYQELRQKFSELEVDSAFFSTDASPLSPFLQYLRKRRFSRVGR